MDEARLTRLNPAWRKALQISLALLLLPASLYSACFVCRFWNPWWGKLELPGPAGTSHRAFVQFRDQGGGDYGCEGGPDLVLRVLDWPATFARPLEIESYRRLDRGEGSIHWSGDGSVIALRKGSHTFVEAYDFKKHQLLASDYSTPGSAASIRWLMEERGGTGPDVGAGADSYSRPEYRSSPPPWWGRMLPVALLLLGLPGAKWLLRGMQRIAAERAGNLQLAKNPHS